VCRQLEESADSSMLVEPNGFYLYFDTSVIELSHAGHSYVRWSWPGLSGSMRASHISVPQ